MFSARSSPILLASAIACTALASTAAALSGAALAATPSFYLKVQGVDGDITSQAGDKWFVADSFSFGVEREMKESGEKGGTEDINIGVGELQEVTISKSMDSSTPAPAKARPMTWDNVTNKAWTGRAPLPRGSLTLMVPAGKCRVGARYPSAEFGTARRVYRMQRVTVTACSAASSAGARPMEQLSLNYEEIK